MKADEDATAGKEVEDHPPSIPFRDVHRGLMPRAGEERLRVSFWGDGFTPR